MTGFFFFFFYSVLFILVRSWITPVFVTVPAFVHWCMISSLGETHQSIFNKTSLNYVQSYINIKKIIKQVQMYLSLIFGVLPGSDC